MKRVRFSEEQIIGILKRSELEVNEAQRLRQLEEENRRLKHLVAYLEPGQGGAESGDLKKSMVRR